MEVTFKSKGEEQDFGAGWLERAKMEPDATYILRVAILDNEGEIFEAFDAAMARAIASGYEFMHLRCIRSLAMPKPPDQTRWLADLEADRTFLKAVDNGEEKLRSFAFEKIAFDDELTTKAAAFSWTWRDWEFDSPRYRDPRMAQWRRAWLPHRR